MRRRALALAGNLSPAGQSRLNVTLRVLVALPGGYGLASLGGVALGLWLPLSRADRAMAGTLSGLLLWPIVFIAAFGISSLRRLMLGVGACMGVLALMAFAAGWRP
ncbi:hypothetical protein B0W47_15695 [Komagataeibacter nataicola]|uniref:Iron transporter n=1 Tax=Komagataeibacter nataicola TaxID=265960 RepID=A0A9N7CB18_9PROT|nr:hypothetical protein B0W47_15695 [Komagataeibacter nataicola]